MINSIKQIISISLVFAFLALQALPLRAVSITVLDSNTQTTKTFTINNEPTWTVLDLKKALIKEMHMQTYEAKASNEDVLLFFEGRQLKDNENVGYFKKEYSVGAVKRSPYDTRVGALLNEKPNKRININLYKGMTMKEFHSYVVRRLHEEFPEAVPAGAKVSIFDKGIKLKDDDKSTVEKEVRNGPMIPALLVKIIE